MVPFDNAEQCGLAITPLGEYTETPQAVLNSQEERWIIAALPPIGSDE